MRRKKRLTPRQKLMNLLGEDNMTSYKAANITGISITHINRIKQGYMGSFQEKTNRKLIALNKVKFYPVNK